MARFFHLSVSNLWFIREQLKDTSLFPHSNDHPLFCTFVDNSSDVHCTVAKKLADYASEDFHGSLAGFGFWGVLSTTKDFPLVYPTGEVPWYIISAYENGSFCVFHRIAVLTLGYSSGKWDFG
jgi:hypothetical protein